MEHKDGSFKGYKSFNIYYQRWLPESGIKAIILIAHGFAEHSGRYGNVVHHFVPKGYAVYALDHRGHGKSDGERVQVDDFSDYVKDLKIFYDSIRNESPEKKIFLIGHSMGSAISLMYALQYQHELSGLVTSGGGITKPGDPPPPPRPAGESLPASMLSRDPAVIEAYENDPLVYRGPIPQGLSSKMRGNLSEKVPEIKLPVLIMAGDGGNDGAHSQVLYDYIGSSDKTIKRYPGLLHEIFNEPEHLQVMANLEFWLESHL